MGRDFVRELSELWRARADDFEQLGQPGAKLVRAMTVEMEKAVYAHDSQLLTPTEAAAESGYTEETLREMTRRGRLPDGRAPGSQGRILTRRCDLPRKPGMNGFRVDTDGLAMRRWPSP